MNVFPRLEAGKQVQFDEARPMRLNIGRGIRELSDPARGAAHYTGRG